MVKIDKTKSKIFFIKLILVREVIFYKLPNFKKINISEKNGLIGHFAIRQNYTV